MKIHLLFLISIFANLQAMNKQAPESEESLKCLQNFVAEFNRKNDAEKMEIILNCTVLSDGQGKINPALKNIPTKEWSFWIAKLVAPKN